MTKATIAILEDDPELQALLERGLAEEGFQPTLLSTGAELLEQVDELGADAFVVDIGLPDSDGRDVCQALRSRGIHSPVLFLTARESVAERISGFDAGGDDYLTKPFAFSELVARLHALLRRGGTDTAVEAAGLRLDPVTHAVATDSATVPLSPTEFRLLAPAPGPARRSRSQARPDPRRLAARRNRSRQHARRLHRAAAAEAARATGGAGDRDRARHRLPDRLMQIGLRRRLLLVVVTAVAVAVCGLVVAFDLVLDHSLERDADTLVRTRAVAELGTLRVTRNGVREAETPNDATPAAGIWVFSNGRAIEKPRVGPSVHAAARAAAARPFRYSDIPAADQRLYALPVSFHGKRVGTIVAATSLGPYEESRRTALVGSLVFAVRRARAGRDRFVVAARARAAAGRADDPPGGGLERA